MMSSARKTLHLAGSPEDLFSHMVLWGLAAICEDAGLEEVRGSWSTDLPTHPILHVRADPEDVAEAVLAHARLRAAEDSWLRETFALRDGAKPTTIATMAPRTAYPTTQAAWQELTDAQDQVTRRLPSALDARLIAGLGVRAWWRWEGTSQRPDRGCNQWEMRTRNRGMDVVKDRLLPLASEVQGWSVQAVLDGLRGDAVNDAVGKNAATSRTATGFRLPGPVDNARAWCALWGLSLLPVLPRRDSGGHSPAWVRRADVEDAQQNQLLMVVPSRPLGTARVSALLNSKQLLTAAQSARYTPAERDSALRWLGKRGAHLVMAFPVRVGGSASAPERQALSGKLVTA